MDRGLLRRVLVTDRRLLQGRPFAATVADRARDHGATSILVREKDLDEAVLLALVRSLVARSSVPVLVSHRPAVVTPSGAIGVHLGWTSPSVAEARKLLEPGAIVGVSVHDVQEGEGRFADGADYLFLGPIRSTPKPHGPVAPLGLGALRDLARRVPVPVVGIGGLGPGDETAVLGTGAAGLAAIRAFG